MFDFKKCLEEVKTRCSEASQTASAQRRLFKKGYSFSKLPAWEQIYVWDYVWTEGTSFWVKVQSFFFCETQLNKASELIRLWPVISRWVEQVDNWALSDCLSKIYSAILEIDPQVVYPVLVEWSKSENPWKRRQSLVSLIYYSSVRQKIQPFKKVTILIRNLLDDPAYYVQKGLGWTLRELHNVYPEDTYKFLHDNIKRLSPVAFGAATQKLSVSQKQELKDLRKK